MRRKEAPFSKATVIDHSDRQNFGPVVLGLPEGDALCHDALSMTCSTVEDGDGVKHIMLVTVAVFLGEHLGILSPMTPAMARNLAASMIGAADQIDGGAGGLN